MEPDCKCTSTRKWGAHHSRPQQAASANSSQQQQQQQQRALSSADARCNSKLPGIRDTHLLTCLATLAAHALHLPQNVHALHHLSEDHMLAIQPTRHCRCNEKLRTVRVRSSVGHAEETGSGVQQVKVFILKLVTINAPAASTIEICEISTLDHETRDDAVKWASFVAVALCVRAKCLEIVNGLRHNASVQAEDKSACRLSANADIEENL
mmetsp:Transcript_98389/g.190025  ORF Transcript_98389/g.190025 Transcript_98389/m.190025 type:complete len:210 (+) Transcript_98389:43-672(+)